MVPRAGLEPARILLRGILSPLCLPIPPPGEIYKAQHLSLWDSNPLKIFLKKILLSKFYMQLAV